MTISSIRQNVEAGLLAWLKASFEGKDEFTGVTFLKGQTSKEVLMPLACGICLSAEEVEMPGLGIFKADGVIVLMTSIDSGSAPDDTSRLAVDNAHRTRADCVANKTEDVPGMIAALNSTGQLFIYGCNGWKSSHEVLERHYVDRFEGSLMCRCV